MTFPSVRDSSGGSEANSTAPTYTLPATISSGDAILVLAGTDNVATHTAPSGFSEISQQDGSAFQFQLFAKISNGTEGGTSVDGVLSASESMCYIALAIQDWSGDLADIEINTIVTATSVSADPGSITASWGSADNLFIAAVIADFWNNIATVFPTSYTLNQLTQTHVNEFGGTQAVSLAARNLASATDDPSAFTTTSALQNGAASIVIKPDAGAGGGSIINQLQNSNLGSDLFNGTIQ